jgi:hypothetical protein
LHREAKKNREISHSGCRDELPRIFHKEMKEKAVKRKLT